VSCTPGCRTCARLGDAALAIIGEVGANGLSHEALELRAGLTPGEAARHYPTVESCVHGIYEQVCEDLAAEFAGAFSLALSWSSALALAQRRVLSRLASQPAEARLCFVEALRGDRELRRRRDLRRRWIVDFLTEQHLRLGRGATTSKLQIELLVGARFQAIASMVEAGRASELLTLDGRFDELTTVFDPSLGRPRFTPPVPSRVVAVGEGHARCMRSSRRTAWTQTTRRRGYESSI
jgi:AcrR family transcriptional regulator